MVCSDIRKHRNIATHCFVRSHNDRIIAAAVSVSIAVAASASFTATTAAVTAAATATAVCCNR